MPDQGSIANTVTFFQGAFTIVLSLALGEALKAFTSDNQDLPVHWDRVPALLAFLLVFFPFFQSMSHYFYFAYLNPPTALKFYSGFLVFDGVIYMLQAGCFFTMSRSLAPHRWQRFYTTLLILILINICWNVVSYSRGVHVVAWLSINVFIVAAILSMLWFERGKLASMRPSYIGLALLTITTALGYWLEQDMYFS
jgi:hypothetical protein